VKRENVDFETFKKNYISQPHGYFSVYSAFEEDDDGDFLRILNLDMICEWRLTDGKVRFLAIPFESEEQFIELVEYLKVTAKLLNDEILKRIDELKYSEITRQNK